MDDEMPCQWNSHRGGMCFNAAVDGRLYCLEHLEYRRQYMKAYRAKRRKPEPETKPERVCQSCTGEAVDGKKFCELHLQYRKKYMQRYRDNKTREKLAVNHLPRTCRECNRTKEAVAFFAYKDVYGTICKACVREKVRKAKA